MKSELSVIIIAGGMGSRLLPLTANLPKCMLEFHGKTMLQRQIDIFRDKGIQNIHVVTGYRKEKINYEGLIYHVNNRYRDTGILEGLFTAKTAIKGEVILAYADIIFLPSVLDRLLESNQDIAIVVDLDWRTTYKGRTDHPESEAETVILDSNRRVLEIGKIVTDKSSVHGEFIGMAKLSGQGSELFVHHYECAKALYAGKPYQMAKYFELAYLTDIFQHMVHLGVDIHSVFIEGGWREIDTVQDYENALHQFFVNAELEK